MTLTNNGTGTLTIEREGEPTTTGPTTWAFEVVSGTNLQTFNVTITGQSTHFVQGTTQANFGASISVGGGALNGRHGLGALSAA